MDYFDHFLVLYVVANVPRTWRTQWPSQDSNPRTRVGKSNETTSSHGKTFLTKLQSKQTSTKANNMTVQSEMMHPKTAASPIGRRNDGRRNEIYFVPDESIQKVLESDTVTVMSEDHKYAMIISRQPVTLSHCPHCSKAKTQTSTVSKATTPTWLCVAAGAVLFLPLCWIPLVVKPMKQTNHFCQECGTKVGRVKPFK